MSFGLAEYLKSTIAFSSPSKRSSAKVCDGLMSHSGIQEFSAGMKLVFHEAAEERSGCGSVEAVVVVENSDSHRESIVCRKTSKNITLINSSSGFLCVHHLRDAVFDPRLNRPRQCPICEDERQYVGLDGQQVDHTSRKLGRSRERIHSRWKPGVTAILTKPVVRHRTARVSLSNRLAEMFSGIA